MIYAKKVSTTDKRFSGRSIIIGSDKAILAEIPVLDNIILCNGCNQNLYPGEGYLVYLSKRELVKDLPYDIFCLRCLNRYFPKHKLV